SKEHGKLPLLRDVDSSYYLRQEKYGLNLGPYERNCKAHWVDPSDPMPEDFSFQLYADDLERLEWYIEDAMARVPILGKAGISRVINGPIPYAPDGNPLIGPMPGVPNAFEACVFTFGIAQAGGAGKVLAEWVTEGGTEWDMWACDPRRFTDYTDHDYCVAKAREVYGHEYAMHFPWHEWPAGRPKKLSPVHERVAALGGQFGAYNGWERANWFAKEGDDTSEEATHTWGRSGAWEPRIREECEAVRDGVGVLDLPGFARFELKGEGAAEWLRGRIAGALPKVGRMNLAYFPDARGRILTEMSLQRHGEDDFTLITAASAQWHDYEVLWRAGLPEGVRLTDRTAEVDTLIVTGPQSRALLETIDAQADLSLPWLSHQDATVAGRPCRLVRVSFAGELGWEVHAANADMPAIYEAVLGAGAKPFGMWALNTLRLEKGYRAWKADLSTDYTLLEAGLERFIRFDKPQDFPGKAALLAEKQQGSKKRFATLIVDAGEADAPYMSTIWHDGQIVGETTSGGWGYRVGASIAFAMLRPDLAVPGTEVEVEIYGERRRAVVQPEGPLWDPANERLRA
ncbi:MAG: FAD-dependent oxidoreductase, partial [Alphaproteobacteria bacterium]